MKVNSWIKLSAVTKSGSVFTSSAILPASYTIVGLQYLSLPKRQKQPECNNLNIIGVISILDGSDAFHFKCSTRLVEALGMLNLSPQANLRISLKSKLLGIGYSSVSEQQSRMFQIYICSKSVMLFQPQNIRLSFGFSSVHTLSQVFGSKKYAAGGGTLCAYLVQQSGSRRFSGLGDSYGFASAALYSSNVKRYSSKGGVVIALPFALASSGALLSTMTMMNQL